MTTTARHFLFAHAALAAALAAQGPDLLITYSQPETTLSGSNGTPLQNLFPNEISHLQHHITPCTLSAEKWSPRDCFHVMAGDENSNAMYWNPTIFGSIDALVEGVSMTPIAGSNPRSVFFSPSLPMGNGVSALPLRPGDVGRIVRNTSGDGQVEYFLRMEDTNTALGLPITTVIDVDAIAFSTNYGVFFSLDQDYTITTPCGPMLLQDGAIAMIPNWAITYTSDFRVASVLPNSAFVLYDELAVDAMVANAQVTNRFGVCLTTAGDLEALDIDWSGAGSSINPCPGAILWAPDLIFSVENGTGASVLSTQFGGSIYGTTCSLMGSPCSSGLPTFGPQTGIRPTSASVGAPSYVNALCSTFTLRYALQVRNHVLNSSPSGLAAGASLIDINSPAPLNFIFVTFAPSGVNAVPTSFPGSPWSLFGFPDMYPLNNYYMWSPTIGGTSTFPSFAIPPNFPVKLLFQSVGIVNGLVEFSTPAILDIL